VKTGRPSPQGSVCLTRWEKKEAIYQLEGTDLGDATDQKRGGGGGVAQKAEGKKYANEFSEKERFRRRDLGVPPRAAGLPGGRFPQFNQAHVSRGGEGSLKTGISGEDGGPEDFAKSFAGTLPRKRDIQEKGFLVGTSGKRKKSQTTE